MRLPDPPQQLVRAGALLQAEGAPPPVVALTAVALREQLLALRLERELKERAAMVQEPRQLLKKRAGPCAEKRQP